MIQKFRFLAEIRKFCKFKKFLKFNESVVDVDESQADGHSFWLVAISQLFLIKS